MITPEEAEANPEEYLGRDVALVNNDVKFSNNNDFAFINHRSNLLQSIKNRLLTNIGELSNHAEYGSMLPDIINQKRNIDSIGRIKGVIRSTLLQDPRIDNINRINVTFENGIYNVNIQVSVINTGNDLNLIFNLFQ